MDSPLLDLLANEDRRVRAFPVAKDQVYLANAGICPLPACVQEAMAAYLAGATSDDQESVAGDLLNSTRMALARFLKVDLEEIALLGSTSNALSVVSAGFPFEAGDNMVFYQDDYPSNVYPWLALTDQGVELRSIQPEKLGRITVDDVLREVDSRTRLVALASCHYLTGFRLDLDEVGGALRERNIAFCLDGIQSLGAFSMSLQAVDFMAADAHKWMLGPCHAGVLFVRRKWVERLRVTAWGWQNVRCPGFLAQKRIELISGAARFEPGTANLVGLVGLRRAIELLEEWGQPFIGEQILKCRSQLREQIEKAGFPLIVRESGEDAVGGIISFADDRGRMDGLMHRLRRNRIRASLRQTPQGAPLVRFSPHAYNTSAELARVGECFRG